MESSIYERERRDKVQKLRELGLDPFGGRTEGILPLAEVRALHKPEFGQDGGPIVTVSGRVMFRNMACCNWACCSGAACEEV